MSDTKDPLKGYRGLARSRLEQWGMRVWGDVRIRNTAGSTFEGVILPRGETFDDLHVVLKLKTGYNVGIHVDRIESMEELGFKEAVYKIPEKAFPVSPDLPNVTLLGTGGTIASRLDYRTGAVIPAFTPGELYGAVPELAELCNLTTRKIFGVFSENMSWVEYVTLAEAVGEAIDGGADGIVIGHGTDTMGHTASVLSFMVQNSRPEPDSCRLRGSARRYRRGTDLHVRTYVRSLRTAAPGYPLPQDAQLLPLDIPNHRRHSSQRRRQGRFHHDQSRLSATRSVAQSPDRHEV
jgi:glutamyl-tRNA(Gln) amidotransferase subunit D